MDRVMLISLSTGMLCFHHRLTAVQEEAGTEKDEMQLASFFAALHHTKECIKPLFSALKEEDDTYDKKISTFEQGDSMWATGLIQHSSGLYILAFYTKRHRYSTTFWKVVFRTMQQELFISPLNNLDQPKIKKQFQAVLQEALTKSLFSLCNNLPFQLNKNYVCKVLTVFSRINSSVGSNSNIPVLSISNISTPTFGNKPPVDDVSPRPKSIELRTTGESVNQIVNNNDGNRKRNNSNNVSINGEIPIKSKSNSGWLCCTSSSSVMAVSHPERPATSVASIVSITNTAPSKLVTPNIVVTTAPAKEIDPKEDSNFRVFSFKAVTWNAEELHFDRIGDQLFSLPINSIYDQTFWEMDNDWNIVISLRSPDKSEEISQRQISPPSPVTTELEDRFLTEANDLTVLSLEDGPPSPPQKNDKKKSSNSGTVEAIFINDYFIVSNGDPIFMVVCISHSEGISINNIWECINGQLIDEFYRFCGFCISKGWLTDKQICV